MRTLVLFVSASRLLKLLNIVQISPTQRVCLWILWLLILFLEKYQSCGSPTSASSYVIYLS